MGNLELVLAEEWEARGQEVWTPGANGSIADLFDDDAEKAELRTAVVVLGKRALDWMVTQATCEKCYHECWCVHHEYEWTSIQDSAKDLG